MTKPLHTPTVKLPLQADMNIHHSPGLMSNGQNWICYVLDNDDEIIARINGFDKEETRATQKLVVDAVNSHETMREALEDIGRALDEMKDADFPPKDFHLIYDWHREPIRAALALAEGK